MKIFKTFDILRRNKSEFYFKKAENRCFENHSHFHLKRHDFIPVPQKASKTAIFAPKGYMWCDDTAVQKELRGQNTEKTTHVPLNFPYQRDSQRSSCWTSVARKTSSAKSGSAVMAAVAAAGKSGLLCRYSIKV